MKVNVALVGMMGSGKTTIGKVLTKKLGYAFIDLDERIEKDMGCSIADIFALKGEGFFREKESELLLEILSSQENGFLLSCGGGAFLAEKNRELLLKKTKTVYLQASSEELYDRLKGDSSRPLLEDCSLEKISGILGAREGAYMEAKYRVCTESRNVKKICSKIMAQLKIEN